MFSVFFEDLNIEIMCEYIYFGNYVLGYGRKDCRFTLVVKALKTCLFALA